MQLYIETDRLIMRKIEPSDAEGFFRLDSDPEVHRYLGKKPVTSIDQCRNIIVGVRRQYEEIGYGRLAIVEKESGEFIGWSGIKYETQFRKDMPYYDLGYRLIRAYWGKGYATEAARASVDFGFTQLNLDVINAAAEIGNIASNKILQNLGFRFIETFDCEGNMDNWYELRSKD